MGIFHDFEMTPRDIFGVTISLGKFFPLKILIFHRENQVTPRLSVVPPPWQPASPVPGVAWGASQGWMAKIHGFFMGKT